MGLFTVAAEVLEDMAVLPFMGLVNLFLGEMAGLLVSREKFLGGGGRVVPLIHILMASRAHKAR